MTMVHDPGRCDHRDRETRPCRSCRREQVIAAIARAEGSLPSGQVAQAVDAVTVTGAALRELARAIHDDPRALEFGAPPVVTRLVVELVARGSTTLHEPACGRCARTGRPLTRTPQGGFCKACAQRGHVSTCARCGQVKPVAARIDDQPACERCRRAERGHRRCGRCGRIASIVQRADGDSPDLCGACYRLPTARCSNCGRQRPCTFADTDTPVCKTCAPRSNATCSRCGMLRPPAARWPEGPVCDPCYTRALRARSTCTGCGQRRRLVHPPGPDATICSDCAGLPPTHACTDCGIEDKLFEQGRCARCSLRRRTTNLLRADNPEVPAIFQSLLAAITASPNPYSALNWIRTSRSAQILTDITAGRTALTHDALDTHQHPRAADHLRHLLVAHGLLPPRDAALASTERWTTTIVDTIRNAEHRRILKTFVTWQVMHRLRRNAAANPKPRTYTANARNRIKTAARFLTWLDDNNQTLNDCSQTTIDQWLAHEPAAAQIATFIDWAAEHHHCPTLEIPTPPRPAGSATIDDDHRWSLVNRLLHDAQLDPTDRIAGCLVLLFGQQQSRIATMTTDQITKHDDEIFIRFGVHPIPVPEPLGTLLLDLAHHGRTHHGVGSPTNNRWLFPGGQPGRPITPARLAERLRKLGIPTQAARRTALIDLAAKIPAAVLAELVNIHPTTAVNWTRQTAGGWSRYAAEITLNHDLQTG